MSEISTSKKYAINTSWILIEKLARIVSGLFIGIFVARFLGPAQLGLITDALNVVMVFTLFSSLGMDSIIVRELITRTKDKNTILGTAFRLRIIGAIIVVIGITSYYYLTNNNQNTIIFLLVSLSVIAQSFSVIDFYFQSAILGKYNAINQVITLVISSAFKLVLLFLNAPVEYFASMVLLEASITAINQLIFYKKNGGHLRLWQFSMAEAKRLLKDSYPLIFSGLAMVIFQKTDQFLIKQFLNLDALGNYAAAARISEASYFIPVAICAAIFPGIVNNRNNKELQLKRLTQLYSILLWTGIVICAGGLLLGDIVIPFLYKEKYYLAAPIFKILVLITIPVFFGTAWGMWMFAENKQKYMVFFQVAHLIINLGLNYTLIPTMGVRGAALSILIINYLGLFNMLTFYKPKTTWPLFIKALNPKNLIDILQYIRPGGKN